MKFIKIIVHIFAVLILTVLTQIGGIIYLIFLPLNAWIQCKIVKNNWIKTITIVSFLAFYSIICLLCVPLLAKINGREQLPIFASKETPLKARNLWFVLCNRTYVKSKLKTVVIESAQALAKQYADVELVYLDSGFPFFDGCPLPPHLSHDDGKKIDITFIYKRLDTNKYANTTPSPIGYGICEEPKPNEYDRPAECARKGFSYYSFMKNHIISQQSKAKFEFDERATAFMIQTFIANPSVRKILIEPHLKTRLGFEKEPKIGLHACFAVRHDDHIHVQI